MVYRHEFFILNSDSQIVYDIQNRELHIVGNAYTLLLTLCEKSLMDISEVKELLGIDKNYEGRMIQEDVEQINHAVGAEIVFIKEVEDEFEQRTEINLKGGVIKEK